MIGTQHGLHLPPRSRRGIRAGAAGATALALAFGAAACSSDSGSTSTNADSNAKSTCNATEKIASWPAKQKVGQLLMGGVSGELGTEAISDSIKAVRNQWVGGINYLGSMSQYAFGGNELAQVYDAGGAYPPFLAVDEEGGRIQRMMELGVDNPSARVMGQTMSADQVQKAGKAVGRAMRRKSLNMDLAPVADVSSQPDDAVIGDRSFSGNPAKVAEYAGAFANGLRKAGIVPVLKHFPGLGSGSANTDFEHASTPPINKLRNKDLKPYESLLLEEPVAVMMTNATVPGLTTGQDASLSPAAYQLLRDDYGFTGVIMTDSLSPVAYQKGLTMPEVARKALNAGADIVVWDALSIAPDIRNQLARDLASGKLDEKKVDASVARVMALKGIDVCSAN